MTPPERLQAGTPGETDDVPRDVVPDTSGSSASPAADDGAGVDLDDDADVDAYIEDALGTIPRPIDWRRLTHDQAASTWAALDTWVRWLVTRYALDHRDVPPCWYAHGDLVEELTALMTAHQAAFDRTGAATGPLDWHQTLATTRTRLQLWAARTGCRHREHRTPTPPAWAAPDAADYADAFTAHVLSGLATRPSTPR